MNNRLLLFPQKKVTWPETILSFLLITTFSPLPPSVKTLHFVQPLRTLDTAQFMNCWIKPIRSSHLLHWILFFNNPLEQNVGTLMVISWTPWQDSEGGNWGQGAILSSVFQPATRVTSPEVLQWTHLHLLSPACFCLSKSGYLHGLFTLWFKINASQVVKPKSALCCTWSIIDLTFARGRVKPTDPWGLGIFLLGRVAGTWTAAEGTEYILDKA